LPLPPRTTTRTTHNRPEASRFGPFAII